MYKNKILLDRLFEVLPFVNPPSKMRSVSKALK